MERRFELPWDRALRVSTAFFVLLLLGVGVGVPWFVWRAAHGDPSALPGVLLPLLAVVVILPLAWALAPRALVLRGGSLVVDRPVRPVEIPPGYWVNLSVFMSVVVGLLGLALAAYLVAG